MSPPAPPPDRSSPERFRYFENGCSFEAIVAQLGKFCKPYHGTTTGCMVLNRDHNMLGYGWGTRALFITDAQLAQAHLCSLFGMVHYLAVPLLSVAGLKIVKNRGLPGIHGSFSRLIRGFLQIRGSKPAPAQ